MLQGCSSTSKSSSVLETCLKFVTAFIKGAAVRSTISSDGNCEASCSVHETPAIPPPTTTNLPLFAVLSAITYSSRQFRSLPLCSMHRHCKSDAQEIRAKEMER
uniref:Uncharacterized protein n=1 Tax=Anguilla anguilla TaxID=7936 RepID=A0A0E9PZI3_ANGAN